MRKSIFLLSAGSFAWLACLSQVSFAREYSVDSGHSNVDFTVRHFVSKLKGSFKEFSGDMSFDPDYPEKAKVNAIAKVESIDTNEKKRDDHLRNEDFFDAKKHPTLSFVSKEVKPDGDKKYKVLGDLTMHGVTKPVTFDVEYLGETDDSWGNHRAGFIATTTVNRKDYGISWNKTADKGGFVLGDDVAINLNLEMVEKKAEKPAEKKSELKKKK